MNANTAQVVALAIIVFALIMFAGDPDLIDGIICWLSDGSLTPGIENE